VSSDFLDSDYCYDLEMKRAIERHDQGFARVIPVILRDVDWQRTPLGKLQALPKGAKPVKSWRDIDEALRTVADGIRATAEELNAKTNDYTALIAELDEMVSEIAEAPFDARSRKTSKTVVTFLTQLEFTESGDKITPTKEHWSRASPIFS